MWSKFLVANLKVFIVWSLLFTAAGCFWGKTGIGVTAVILALITIL